MREIAENIIETAALGDMAAFEEVYKAYSSTVYTIALGITKNRQDAEEVAQDVFVKIFRNLKNFKFDSSFGTWVYRIAINAAINMYNNRARRAAGTIKIDDISDIPDSTPVAKIEWADSRKDAQEKLARILKSLNVEHRSVIILREIEGLDYKDMADVLGIPLNTVRSRLKRAREALIAVSKKEGIHYEM